MSDPAPRLAAGRALAAGHQLGPYEILALIGAGGMGEVYRARDTRLGREVAIKIISDRLAEDPQALRRFEKEARSVAALSHPNILAIHDFNGDSGISYVVMELLRGESLQDRLAREQLSWRTALETAAAVADGLAAAHARGIVHRDLKPANIFLTSEGQVKILDFGLATQLEAGESVRSSVPTASAPGHVLGTVGYMAPEQVSGGPVDARSDIFALGCVLYEMISGRHAFVRDSVAETFAAILRDNPPELPESAGAQIVARCLRKNPDERFQSARDLAFALRGIGGSRATRVPKMLWAVVALLTLTVATVGIVRFRTTKSRQPVGSLAVLPFVNTSHDPQSEFLADGMTDTIINKLAELPQLKVMARSTMFRYKGKNDDPERVGRELNVGSVLTGRILQVGDRLDIEAELVNVDDGTQLWGERYDRPMADVFALQDDIAQQISRKLRLKLTADQQKRMTKRETDDPQAYSYYVQGRFYLEPRTVPSIQKAIDAFKAAIQIDPNYALGYVGLADSYALFEAYGGESTWSARLSALAKAREAAIKALSIDPNLAEAHATLGLISQFARQWQDAEEEYRRSIALKPNYANAHHWYAFELALLRRPAESIAEFRKARALDPLSPINNVEMADELVENHQLNEALNLVQETLKSNPDFWFARSTLGHLEIITGHAAEGLAELEKLGRGAELGEAYAQLGRRQEALAIITELRAKPERDEASPVDIARIYAALGDRPNAYRWFDRAVSEQVGFANLIYRHEFDSWRSDPQFQQLLRAMNLAN